MIFAAIADWVDTNSYPVNFMCEQLGVSTSGYYKWRSREPSAHETQDAQLTRLISHFFKALRGNPAPHARGARGGGPQGRPQARLAPHAGRWAAGTPPPCLETDHRSRRSPRAGSGPDRTVLHPAEPNQKWCGDITYIKTWDGWAYVATVIDLHSRALIGWSVDDHMRTSLITDALDMAITHRRPPKGVIFHSDRGTQYTSQKFDRYCKDHNIQRSLGRTGICYDNAVSESFFATYKKELIHTRPWPNLKILKKETFTWIEEYYNRTRRHSTLGYLTPTEYELGYRNIHELAA